MSRLRKAAPSLTATLQIIPQPSGRAGDHAAAMHLGGVGGGDLAGHQFAGGYRLARAVGGAQQDAGGGAEGRTGGGVGQ